MATPIDVFKTVARRTGAVRAQGTAEQWGALSLIDEGNEMTSLSDRTEVQKDWITITSGSTQRGGTRRVQTYVGHGIHFWSKAFSTVSGTPTWMRTWLDPQQLKDAITNASRKFRRQQARTYRSAALVAHSLLDWFGDFEEFNSANTVPTGWTATNATGARISSSDANPPRHGNYCLQVTDSGSGGGYFELIVPPKYYPFLRGVSIALDGHARIETGTGTVRVTVRAVDASGTVTSHDYDVTGTTWKRIGDVDTAQFTLPTTLTRLSVRLTVVTASEVAFFDDLRLMGPYLAIQRLPALMAGLPMQLQIEEGGSAYSMDVSRASLNYAPLQWGTNWSTFHDSVDGNYYIRWNQNLVPGQHILIEGYKFPTPITDFSSESDIELNEDLVATAASIEVLSGIVDSNRSVDFPHVRARVEDSRSGTLGVMRQELADYMRTVEGDRTRGHDIVWLEDY